MWIYAKNTPTNDTDDEDDITLASRAKLRWNFEEDHSTTKEILKKQYCTDNGLIYLQNTFV